MVNIGWYFFIYAFLGWVVEVIYAAGATGKFVNRGFLNGPYCPIYGVGFLLVLHLLQPVKDNIILLFLGAVLITSATELVVGYLLEKTFHQKWWDYSHMPFNIGGYVSLLFSIMWGLANVIIVDKIHPTISLLVNSIPQATSRTVLIILTCIIIIDLIATIRSILILNKKLEIIDEIKLKIRDTADNIGENLAKRAMVIAQKKDELEESIEAKKEILHTDMLEWKEAQQKAYTELLEVAHFGQKRLLKAFPKLRSLEHKEALEKLKSTILNGLGVANGSGKNGE